MAVDRKESWPVVHGASLKAAQDYGRPGPPHLLFDSLPSNEGSDAVMDHVTETPKGPSWPEASAAPASRRVPLSFGQEQLWFLDKLSPGETTYNIGLAYRVRGPIDLEVLRRSLAVIVARHTSLRARFGAVEGTPYQVIAPEGDVTVDVSDFTAVQPDERQAVVDNTLHAWATEPFDLEVGPLYRFRVTRLAPDDHVLFFGFHHIVTDGWSSGVIFGELATVYTALLDDREPELDPLPMEYVDYVEQQRAWLGDAVLEEELQHWERYLAELPVLELPSNRLRPATPSHRGESVIVDFPEELQATLRSFAHEHGVSLFMVLAAATSLVLSRYTGLEDIPIGVTMLGRTDPELERVVGLFVNMVVLRVDVSGDPTFAELLDHVADASLDLYEHQEVPFEKVVQRVQPVRELGRNPLFQVSVQLLGSGNSGGNLELAGVEVEAISMQSTRARFDMALNFLESPERLQTAVEYSTDLFDRWWVEAMVGHITHVLKVVSKDPMQHLSAVSVLSDIERQELLADGQGELAEYTDEPVHVTVTKIAASTPEAVAAICRGEQLSYGELDHRACLVARYLRSRGLDHEQVVAIVMDRGLDTLVAMLGVMKAGAAFAMMDPAHPKGRLDYMIQDTGAPLVITRKSFAEHLPEPSGWATVLLDAEWSAIESSSAAEPLQEWATDHSLAYVLYTSGSTGKPKGVLIEHRALRCFVEAYRRTFDFCAEDRLLQLPALTFDMSQGEIFTALTVGAALVLVSPEEGLSPSALAELMREQRVTYAGLSPAMLSVVEPSPYPHLRYVMGGADALPAELVNKWNLPGRRFVNLYGPTEAAIACTEYECEHVTWQSSPPIGRPELNRRVYVVDRWGGLVPKGVPGELLIGGEGLARGYLNQPELTAEKFVPDPFRPDELVYRSGDLVRWTRDGQIDFIGRIDNQVKLRGLRIELGEIESALLTHPGVRMVTVLLRDDPGRERQLVGYITSAGTKAPSPAILKRHLMDQLPEYMVPTAWVVLDEFPLTAARKIDRAALPPPDGATDGDGRRFVPPATPTEQEVAAIFAEILSLPQVSSDDNFFDLGGNSLQAMRVVSRINKAFGVKVNIRLLYGTSTLSKISAKIDNLVGAAEGGRQ